MPDRLKAILAAGEELVAVGLMSGVPDDSVIRGVKNVMEGDRELGGAEG